MKCTVTLAKITVSPGLNIVGGIWDIVCTNLNKIYEEGLVVFRHCNSEMLHSVALKQGKRQLTLKDLNDLRYV